LHPRADRRDRRLRLPEPGEGNHRVRGGLAARERDRTPGAGRDRTDWRMPEHPAAATVERHESDQQAVTIGLGAVPLNDPAPRGPMSESRSANGRDLWRFIPIVRWIRSYQRSWLRGDLIAGVTVAALVVPKNLGYAGIAGVPLQNGLYAAAAGAILYAVFGTSRQISTGPSSGLAAVAASAVAVAGVTGIQDVASFVAMITLVSGALFLLLAVLKMGWIAQFLSQAVVTGFLFGAAIDVVIGELPKLTGTKVTGSNPLQELWSWLGTLGDASLVTVFVGAVSLAVVFGLRVIAPRIPGALVLVVGGLLATEIFDLGAHGVALVGPVPRGLPSLELPDWQLVVDHAGTIALAAVALVLIGFSQTAGD